MENVCTCLKFPSQTSPFTLSSSQRQFTGETGAYKGFWGRPFKYLQLVGGTAASQLLCYRWCMDGIQSQTGLSTLL